MSGTPKSGLLELIERARQAPPSSRIELRDLIAGYGQAAVDLMSEWLADPALTRFAVRVIGRAAELGEREAAVRALRLARDEATPDQRADIDLELRRLGVPGERVRRSRLAIGERGPSVPAWMMRTNRYIADWIWSEVVAGRLRQGWGYQAKQDLTLLRHRREQGEPTDQDDDWAWPNRRMLFDEPDGMQVGDLVLAPHLPREWRWSVLRITGPYRYDIDAQRGDYGHILPVEILTADLEDRALTPYPARLRRLSRRAYEDLTNVLRTRRTETPGRTI